MWDFPAIPGDGDERRLPKRADHPGFTGTVAVNEQPKLIADLRLLGALRQRAGSLPVSQPFETVEKGLREIGVRMAGDAGHRRMRRVSGWRGLPGEQLKVVCRGGHGELLCGS